MGASSPAAPGAISATLAGTSSLTATLTGVKKKKGRAYGPRIEYTTRTEPRAIRARLRGRSELDASLRATAGATAALSGESLVSARTSATAGAAAVLGGGSSVLTGSIGGAGNLSASIGLGRATVAARASAMASATAEIAAGSTLTGEGTAPHFIEVMGDDVIAAILMAA